MGTVKMILGLGLIAALIVAGIAIIPPFFANYQFEDVLKNEALAATYSSRPEEEIKTSVLKKAKDLDIPLTEKQLKVVRTGTYGTGTLTISADYTVPVNLPGYETSLEFHPSSTNKGTY
jgi:hypothetical protein